MDNKVERVRTDISEPQMAQAIIAAWSGMFGTPPSKEQVSMILAQNNLETGNRKSMWNYNVGNITHTKGDGFDYSESQDWHYDNNHQKVYYTAKFRAYPDLQTGVTDYLKLLKSKHYAGAFEHILHPDPAAFSKALKAGGYYGADEKVYTAGITRLFNDANKGSSYEQAVSGRIQPPAGGRPSAPAAEPSFGLAALEKLWEKFEPMLSAASTNHDLKKLYKKALPNHDILIKIAAPDYTCAVEFSRILCAALDEDLLTTTYPYTDGQEVEVEVSIPGPPKECFAAVQQMTNAVAETFKDATTKIGRISIKTNCLMNKKSSYQPISLRTAGANYRKFLLKFV